MQQGEILRSEGAVRPKHRDRAANDGEEHSGEPIAGLKLTANQATRTRFVEATGSLQRAAAGTQRGKWDRVSRRGGGANGRLARLALVIAGRPPRAA